MNRKLFFLSIGLNRIRLSKSLLIDSGEMFWCFHIENDSNQFGQGVQRSRVQCRGYISVKINNECFLCSLLSGRIAIIEIKWSIKILLTQSPGRVTTDLLEVESNHLTAGSPGELGVWRERIRSRSQRSVRVKLLMKY